MSAYDGATSYLRRIGICLGVVVVAIAGVTGCNLTPDLTLSYEFHSPGKSLADLKNVWVDKDSIASRSYMYYFHAFSTLRPTWPPPESALMFPPAPITDDEGTYDSVNGKPGCWLNNSGMSVTYDFFCGKAIQWPAKPPIGVYRVQVSADSSWSVEVPESRLVQGTEGVYIPLPRLVADGSEILTALEWTWWLKENGTWRGPTAGELQNELRYASMELGLQDGSRVHSNVGYAAPTGSVPIGNIPFAQVTWLRMSHSDRAGYNYGFEWR